MRRSMSIAVLTGALVIGTGMIATGQKNFLASAQEKPATTEAKIDNFSFGPATLTVPSGQNRTLANHEDIPITVARTDGKCKYNGLHTGRQVSLRVHKSGTFPHFC